MKRGMTPRIHMAPVRCDLISENVIKDKYYRLGSGTCDT